MAHQPTRRIAEDSDTAILFIHGIVGTPNHFRDLLPLVPDDWSCVTLLLPGHGGSVRDFSRASMAQWRSYVTEQVDQLAARHRRIFLAGHSMGTLFCIDEALRRGDQVAGLFLLAPPFYPQLTLPAAWRCLQVALGMEARTPTLQATYDACSITHTRKLWQYISWLPRFLELFAAARQGRAQIKELTNWCAAALYAAQRICPTWPRTFSPNPDISTIRRKIGPHCRTPSAPSSKHTYKKAARTEPCSFFYSKCINLFLHAADKHWSVRCPFHPHR